MVRLIEHGRNISTMGNLELIVILKRPLHAAMAKGIEVSGVGYKSGTQPSPSLENKSELERWARKNNVPISNLNPPLIALVDAFHSLANQTQRATLAHLKPGSIQYSENPDEYRVSINADLYAA